jgi:hypothetical protein
MLCMSWESRKKDFHFYKVLINLLESGDKFIICFFVFVSGSKSGECVLNVIINFSTQPFTNLLK